MTNTIVDVLVIEDHPEQIVLLRRLLLSSYTVTEFRLQSVDSLAAGLAALATDNFGLVLLDLSLPDSNGIETFVRIAEVATDVAIVVLSGTDDVSLAIETVQLGAQDYLVKGHLDNHLLVRSMQYAVERKRSQLQLKRAYEELESRVKERTGMLQQANARLQKEIAERKRAEEETLESNRQLATALNQLQETQTQSSQRLRRDALASVAETLVEDFEKALSPLFDSCEVLLNEPRVIAEPLKIGNYIQLIQRSAMEGVAVVERLREFQSDDDGVREPADVFSNEPSQGAAQTEELPAEGAQSLRILVVDDEPLVREVIAIYLGDDNHVITTACNGREGLEVFQSATFDIVLTDRAMPEMNGEQLAIEIKRLKPDQPVILLTGFGESAGEEPPGVDLIVSKPFTINTLRGAIFKSLAP